MNIVILSRSAALYSTQSLIKAARNRNHFVRVIDYQHCDIIVENNKPKLSYYGTVLKNIDAVIPRIGASFTRYGAAVIKQFEAMKVPSTLTPEALFVARDKLMCLQVLAMNGIRVPRTIMTNNAIMYEDLVKSFGYHPLIIKLVSGTHGVGVIKADSHQLAVTLLEAFQKTNQKTILQEFVKESKGADIRIFVVGGEVVATMKRQAKEGEFRSNLHRGGSSTQIKISDEERTTALNAVKALGLDVAGVDILQSKAGPQIIEVNASPGLEGIEKTSGVDIAGKIIDLVEEKVRASKGYAGHPSHSESGNSRQ